jgi:hypothetical protein
LTRERFALVSYFFLLALFVVDFVLILIFPGLAEFLSAWFGPIFALLGAQLSTSGTSTPGSGRIGAVRRRARSRSSGSCFC